MTDKFIKEAISLGVLSYKEQETLWDIAKRCSKLGIAMAGGTAMLGAKGGTILVPGIGTVSMALAGALAGLAVGTLACTAVNSTYRNELRQLVNEAKWR